MSKKQSQFTETPQDDGFELAVFAEQKTQESDCYKFTNEKFLSNVALPGEEPRYVELDHNHIFRTVTSDGKKPIYTSPVGGHFHEVEVIYPSNPEYAPKVICKSGPLKWVRYKDNYGKEKKKVVPVDKADLHKHKVEYIARSIIKPRTLNKEAAIVRERIERVPETPKDVIV